MKTLATFTGVIALLAAAPAIAACDYPSRAKVANGATATKEEMIASQKSVKQFVTAMEAYMECIVSDEKVARAAIEDMQPELKEQREEMLNKKYNAAVEEMEKVAARFNAEVQAYKNKDDS